MVREKSGKKYFLQVRESQGILLKVGILGFFGRSGKNQGILSHGVFKFYKYQCLSISDTYNFFFNLCQ